MHTFCFLRTKPRLSQAGALLLKVCQNAHLLFFTHKANTYKADQAQ